MVAIRWICHHRNPSMSLFITVFSWNFGFSTRNHPSKLIQFVFTVSLFGLVVSCLCFRLPSTPFAMDMVMNQLETRGHSSHTWIYTMHTFGSTVRDTRFANFLANGGSPHPPPQPVEVMGVWKIHRDAFKSNLTRKIRPIFASLFRSFWHENCLAKRGKTYLSAQFQLNKCSNH